MDHLDLIRAQARALPQSPGVYFWQDARGQVLYIGKAVNLRARVSSYFSAAKTDRRTRDMLTRARTVTCEVTATEIEALLRESALIKLRQPPFNRLLRTPRRMFYIRVDTTRSDPYLEMSRGPETDGALYFGPFPTAALTRETMAFLHDVLPLRKCTAVRPRCRPCIYYQMHKCAAPLIDDAHRARHQEAITHLHDLLEGRNDRVAAWLERKRERLAQSLLFEQAAEVQMRLDLLNDHRRQHAILEAAVQCKCVLVIDDGDQEGRRALLIAHGRVVSMRPLAGLTREGLAKWVAVHEPIMDAIRAEQGELDAASVLERWIRCRRETVRWVAIPHGALPEEVQDRVDYVLAVPDRVVARG